MCKTLVSTAPCTSTVDAKDADSNGIGFLNLRPCCTLQTVATQNCSFRAFMGKLLPSVLESQPDAPDKKFLVETWWDNWKAQLLKRYNGHWPETGIVQVAKWHFATCMKPERG